MPPQPNSPSSVCGASTSTRFQPPITPALPPARRRATASATQAEQRPTSSDPRRTRCRTGCARRSRRAKPSDERTRAASVRPTPPERRRRARRRTSQPNSARPGRPVSAATVTGVLCEAAFFGSLARQPRALGVRPLEAADPDAARRGGRARCGARSRPAPSGRSSRVRGPARLVEERVADRGVGEADRAAARAAPSAERARRPPAPDDGRGDHVPRSAREARLREREEQARPTRAIARRRPRASEPRARRAGRRRASRGSRRRGSARRSTDPRRTS